MWNVILYFFLFSLRFFLLGIKFFLFNVKDLYRHYPHRHRTCRLCRLHRCLPDPDSNWTGNCRRRCRSYRCRCPAGPDYKWSDSCRTDLICCRCPRRRHKRRRYHPRRSLPARCSEPSDNCRRDSDGHGSEGSGPGYHRCRCRDRKYIRFRPSRRDTARNAIKWRFDQ